MIQQGIQVMKQLQLLLDIGQNRLKPCFVHLIEPMYRSAERVMHDYTSLHLCFIEQLYTYQDAPAIISWLETQRLEYLPLRVQVGALEIDTTGAYTPSNLRSFQLRMVGFMQGSVSLIEEQGLGLKGDGANSPSILNYLYLRSKQPFPAHRPVLIDIAKKKYQAVEQAWEDVVETYATLKYECRENDSTTPCVTAAICPTTSRCSSLAVIADPV